MTTKFDDLLTGMTDFLKNEATPETIIGKEFKLGEFSCVPVMALGMGIGGGGGTGSKTANTHGEGSGGGAGLGMAPIGFLVTRGADIQFVAAKAHSGFATAIEKLPDLLTTYYENRKKDNHNPHE